MRLRWPPFKLRIRAKLIVSFLVVTFPLSVLLIASDYRNYVDRQSAILETGQAVGQAAVGLVRAQLGQACDIARLALSVADSAGQPSAEAASRLNGLLANHPECRELFVLDSEGQVTAAAPTGRQPSIDSAALSQILSAQAPVVSDLFLTPEQQPVVQVLVPAESAQGFAGAAGVTLDVQALGHELDRAAASGHFSITLCDRRAWSIYSTFDPNMPWEKRNFAYPHIQQALAGQAAASRGVVSRLDQQVYLTIALPVPNVGWAVSVWQPSRDTLGRLRNQATTDLALLAALGLLGLLAAASVGSWFSHPVTRLAEHARALGRGQLNERIDMRTGDEFEDLATALNVMARQMEERDRRLRARTAELDAIITQSADGIAIHGAEGEMLRLNPAGARILGRLPGRVGLSLAEQALWFRMRTAAGQPIDPNDLPIAAALRGETRVAQELRIETETGQERFVAFSASPLSDARGRIYGAVSILRDMTATHQAQQEKDDFISVVSHELKTPITSIKGYAQMLLRRAEESGGDEKELKGLRIINDEVDRMVDLINQLLDVSRLEMRRLEFNWDRVNLTALVSDAVDRLQMTTNRHTLRLRAPEEPLWVRGDTMRLAQVLGNLIMKAIKYSPAGGPIEITLESQEGRAWVSVRDWGLGIALEDQPHMFQRFYRGTRRGSAPLSGMGLGLYISREIVQRHGGDIVFHSQPGQGSTFLFWLPLEGEARPEPQVEKS